MLNHILWEWPLLASRAEQAKTSHELAEMWNWGWTIVDVSTLEYVKQQQRVIHANERTAGQYEILCQSLPSAQYSSLTTLHHFCCRVHWWEFHQVKASSWHPYFDLGGVISSSRAYHVFELSLVYWECHHLHHNHFCLSAYFVSFCINLFHIIVTQIHDAFDVSVACSHSPRGGCAAVQCWR